MASESEEYEYQYAYSSDEDDGPQEDDDMEGEDEGDTKMHWEGASDNPNAAPMNTRYHSGKSCCCCVEILPESTYASQLATSPSAVHLSSP